MTQPRSENQAASSGIWTRVAEFISDVDNRYSTNFFIQILKWQLKI